MPAPGERRPKYLTVYCPRCGVRPGEFCNAARYGYVRAVRAHAERLSYARRVNVYRKGGR